MDRPTGVGATAARCELTVVVVSMLEERDPKVDLLALGLCVVAAFLTVSLISHNAADPPVELVSPFNRLYQMDTVVYPLSAQPTNACGRWGALASALLLDAFGYAAYIVVGSLLVAAVLLLLRRNIDSLFIRVVGWTAALVGLTTLMSMLLPWSPAGTLMGAGGHLGALGAGLLEFHFARAGGFILAASLLVGGTLLSTDYVLLRLAMVAGTLLIAASARNGRTRRRRRTEVVENDADEEQSLASRLRDKAEDADELDEYEEDDGDEEYEDDVYEDDEYEDQDEEEEEEETSQPEIGVSQHGSKVLTVSGRPPSAIIPRKMNRRSRLAALRIHKATDSEEDREEVMNRLDEASEREDQIEYDLPSRDLLLEATEFSYKDQEKEVLHKAKILNETFKSFGFDVRVVDIEMGPVIAQYEVELEAGLRLSKITGLADDLAIALRVPSVRIVAPIPGKNTVGIEVPNSERQLVRLREVMDKTNGKVKKMGIPLFLGKDVSGNPLTVDLSTLPHLLIAGRTGTGKSVCLNAIITSILMTRRPDEVRMLMIDPKMVELSGYGSLPHLMHPVVTDMRKAEAILAWAVEKMEERYELLARAGVRHMTSYNGLSEEEIIARLEPQSEEERKAIPLHMPYIVIVADEMADLMMTAGKEVQGHIIRLAQKSRAVGIHLILATQKPTVDVITGLIKSNLPARIAFQVASRTDSRVVLDEMGADKLLGNGDMLFLSPGTSTLLRGQGTFLSDEEINAVVDECSTGEQNFVKELVQLKVDDGQDSSGGKLKDRDELYEEAVEVVIREGRGSISLLQRALGIGYGRAARLVDFMSEDGIVGPYAGSKTREVVMTMEDWQRMKNAVNQLSSSAAPADETVDEEEWLVGAVDDTIDSEDLPDADDDEENMPADSAALATLPLRAMTGTAEGVLPTDPEDEDDGEAYGEVDDDEEDEKDRVETAAEHADYAEDEYEVDDEEAVDVAADGADEDEYEEEDIDVDGEDIEADGEYEDGEYEDGEYEYVDVDDEAPEEEYEYVYEDVDDEYEEEDLEAERA